MDEKIRRRLKKYILRELHLNIAQLSTARQELPWLHFPLGATLAFLALCAPSVDLSVEICADLRVDLCVDLCVGLCVDLC